MKNTLKNTLLLFTFCIAFYSCKAQEGVTKPLKTISYDVPDGTYMKDLDNVFLDYLGTWEGIWSGKTFQLTIEKIPQHLETHPSGSYYYRDLLIGKYIVKDNATNVELFNTMAISDPNNVKIESIGSGLHNKMFFLFHDTDLCYNSAEITLSRDLSNPNQLFYSFKLDEFWSREGCPYASKTAIPIPIPNINITLTRL